MDSDPVKGIAEQPEALAAKQAITELVYRYGQLVRHDRPEETAELYLPSGVFEVRVGPPDRPLTAVQSRVEGREAIRVMLLPSRGKPHPVPLIHNLSIAVEGDSATGTCVMQSPTSADGKGFWGEYRDRFARIEGRWYFAERVFTMYEFDAWSNGQA
ncbi:MAG: nuclear transport factor 2 family protein [Alphaproteobacteria bacterium]|nr:nuclear transport factor 2 family protein [Alphaproteobacteria bacterium]